MAQWNTSKFATRVRPALAAERRANQPNQIVWVRPMRARLGSTAPSKRATAPSMRNIFARWRCPKAGPLNPPALVGLTARQKVQRAKRRFHRALKRATLLAPKTKWLTPSPAVPSFHTADRQTYRRVVAVALLLCATFVVISFSLRPQADATRVLVKADRLVRTAGEGRRAQ